MGILRVLSRLMTTKEQLVLLALAAAIGIGGIALYVHTAVSDTEPAEPPAKPEPVEIVIKHEQAPPAAPVESILAEDSVLPAEPAVPGEPEPPAFVQVSIMGAVKRPDLYELPRGARVRDLIERAGGAKDEADLDNINLAAPLLDGTTLSIPSRAIARREGDKMVFQGRRGYDIPNPPQYTRSGWRPPPQAATVHANSSGTESKPAAAPARAPGGSLLDLNTATAAQLEELPGIGPVRAADIVRYRSAHPFQSVDELTNISGIGPKTLEKIRPHATVQSR